MEQELEQNLIDKLISQDYEAIELKGPQDLKDNLKRQIEKANEINLSSFEFTNLYNQLIASSTVFTSSSILRDRFLFEREDTTKINLLLYNKDSWCKNTFQVARQIKNPHGNTFKKYDVTILINGFPMVQIELKNSIVKFDNAYKQIVQEYKPSYEDSLFKYIQLFIISNGNTTKYFVNNQKIEKEHIFTYSDENNKKLTSLLTEFTPKFLDKCYLSKIIARYIVLLKEKQELRVLRPYQMYAVEKIINTVENKQGNGYIWHTTGSGKTLTSFKVATLLKDSKNCDKVLFVVDRKDLDKQTINEFNKFQADCVDLTTDTKHLLTKLNSNELANKIIVTTLQKLEIALSKSQVDLEDVKKKRVIFIFDECHRSTFGKTFQAINNFFNNKQLFGFTGTPIKDENATKSYLINTEGEKNLKTTDSLFQKELHSYTIANAIKDKSVLQFNIKHITKPEKLSKENIVKFIFKNYKTATSDKKFNAIFATNSISDAIDYYNIFKQENKTQEYPLKVTAIFSYPQDPSPKVSNNNNSNNSTLHNIEQDLENEQEDKTPYEKKLQAIQEIMADYKKNYNKKFTATDYTTFYNDLSTSFKNYGKAVEKKENHNTIDILIVVDMFLTGYDSPFTQALFVDKNLSYHNLIQTFSRTNRLAEGKYYANIIDFKNLKDATDKAIALYSAKTEDINNSNSFKTKSYTEAKQDFKESVESFKEVFKKNGMDFNTSSWQDEPSESIQQELKKSFANLFKNYTLIHSYILEDEEAEQEQKELEAIIKKENMNDFIGTYKSLTSKLLDKKEWQEVTEQEVPLEIDEINKYLENYIVDYDYIVKLLYQQGKKISGVSSNTLDIAKQDIRQVEKNKIEELIKSSSYVEHQQQIFLENIDEIIENTNNYKDLDSFKIYLNQFLDNKIEIELQKIITKYNANESLIKTYLNKYHAVGTIDIELLENSLPQQGLEELYKKTQKLKKDLNEHIYLKYGEK